MGEPAVLVIYHRQPLLGLFGGDASTVLENVAAFGRHSRFPVSTVNTALGFPKRLRQLRFDALVVHYSVFLHGLQPYLLEGGFREYIAAHDGYKIATFQDEHHWCAKRFQFIDECGIDCVFTCLDPTEAGEVYGRTGASKTVSNLPGYVGPEILKAGARYQQADERRPTDVGYRGRPLPAYMGRGGQEKGEIGERFGPYAEAAGLTLDIKSAEGERIYGARWPKFVAGLRGMLGVESGVSCFDLEDEVRADYERLAQNGHEPTIGELEQAGALRRWEGRIPYRTISPRNFEASALRVCQILYEGRYSGLMEPMEHYIPLRKDFGNVEEVIERFRDPDVRREIADNAHRDLIASEEHTYERFVRESFDPVLEEAGLHAPTERVKSRAVKPSLGERFRLFFPLLSGWLYQNHRVVFRILWLPTRPFALAARGWKRLRGAPQ